MDRVHGGPSADGVLAEQLVVGAFEPELNLLARTDVQAEWAGGCKSAESVARDRPEGMKRRDSEVAPQGVRGHGGQSQSRRGLV